MDGQSPENEKEFYEGHKTFKMFLAIQAFVLPFLYWQIKSSHCTRVLLSLDSNPQLLEGVNEHFGVLFPGF